jgi:hypothetical protein
MDQFKQHEQPISRISMTYGAYIGLALTVVTIIFYISGSIYNSNLQLINYIVLIIGIYITTKKFRDEYSNGLISYSKALGFGTLTIFYGSIIYGFFIYILYRIISPGLIEDYITILEEQFLKTGMETEQVESLTELYRNFMTPFIMGISEIFGKTLFGFIFSLIISLILKNEVNNTEITNSSQNNERSIK